MKNNTLKVIEKLFNEIERGAWSHWYGSLRGNWIIVLYTTVRALAGLKRSIHIKIKQAFCTL